MPRLIDTHSHMFTAQFDDDRSEAITRAVDSGVSQIVLPNIDLDTIPAMEKLSSDFAGVCFSTIGLHPCDVQNDYTDILDQMKGNLDQNPKKYIGIGETGLDYYWSQEFVANQKDALRIQCGWARDYDLPIILHTRDSTSDTIQIIRSESKGSLRGVFHCFSGTQEEAKQIIDLGFYLGIGGTITYKKNEIRNWIDQIPLKYIVLETDSPYLAPVPKRGKRNESSYLKWIAEEIANLTQTDLEKVANTTSTNAEQLFDFNS